MIVLRPCGNIRIYCVSCVVSTSRNVWVRCVMTTKGTPQDAEAGAIRHRVELDNDLIRDTGILSRNNRTRRL